MTNGADDNENDNGDEEDSEAVRCLCGSEDYPGPPVLDDGDIKDGIEEPIVTVAEMNEDAAGFFLQCDNCHVWQHGFCVSIMSEDQSPEEYFCEECRPDFHKVLADKNGYVFSQLYGLTRERGADPVSQG